ncbi:UNVERIFIED_CONTAM: hypothetical protein GTU68_029364 [Idotea baltica]|nr:hypothetical protein [Idotea baltica]
MSGHSKWSTIKRKKAVTDSKRAKVFTRVLKEIQIAARDGGSIDGNPRLKRAVDTAKSNSVPSDNIERAIKRGTGDLEGVDYQEMTYEAYGPCGVGLLIKSLTDNKNRTVAEVRHALSRYNGSLASANAVSYLFNDFGVITVSKENINEEEIFEAAIEAGANDVSDSEDCWEVMTEVSSLDQVSKILNEKFEKEFEAEIRPVPDTLIKISGEDTQSLLKLLDALDELDDIQNVYSNFDIDEKELESLS